MFQSSAALKRNYRLDGASVYLANDINEATPEKLLIKVMDYAIMHSKRGNLENTNKALNLLLSSLRYDNDEAAKVSIGLKKLYDYCQDEMRNKNYGMVTKILSELREAWLRILE